MAPVIGVDDPDKILAWIQQRITCHIPDQNVNPVMHSLVTKYQTHHDVQPIVNVESSVHYEMQIWLSTCNL